MYPCGIRGQKSLCDLDKCVLRPPILSSLSLASADFRTHLALWYWVLLSSLQIIRILSLLVRVPHNLMAFRLIWRLLDWAVSTSSSWPISRCIDHYGRNFGFQIHEKSDSYWCSFSRICTETAGFCLSKFGCFSSLHRSHYMVSYGSCSNGEMYRCVIRETSSYGWLVIESADSSPIALSMTSLAISSARIFDVVCMNSFEYACMVVIVTKLKCSSPNPRLQVGSVRRPNEPLRSSNRERIAAFYITSIRRI